MSGKSVDRVSAAKPKRKICEVTSLLQPLHYCTFTIIGNPTSLCFYRSLRFLTLVSAVDVILEFHSAMERLSIHFKLERHTARPGGQSDPSQFRSLSLRCDVTAINFFTRAHRPLSPSPPVLSRLQPQLYRHFPRTALSSRPFGWPASAREYIPDGPASVLTYDHITVILDATPSYTPIPTLQPIHPSRSVSTSIAYACH